MATPRPELEAYFRRRAVERIEELDTLRARWEHGENRDAAAAIRSTAHQLAGTAAGFGFPAIGDLARAVELAEDDHLDSALGELLAALEGVAST